MINMEINDSWTPLHTRIISHRIGDGTVNSYGRPMYDNKNIEHFMGLLKHLNIRTWKPMISDEYGTKKVYIPLELFKKFALICDCDFKSLVNDSVFLIDNIMKLSYEHRLEALLAVIVDDGSCVNWSITIFEDQNESVTNKVNQLWNSLFTSRLRKSILITEKGTKVYHLYCNRKGILQLYESIRKISEKYGNLANLWWKQKDLENRYSKAVSKRALQLIETLENSRVWKERIIEYVKENGYITKPVVMEILYLSNYRALRLLSNMIRNKDLFLVKAGNRSRYAINREDISLEYREKLIIEHLNNHQFISDNDAQIILKLRHSQAYKTLKIMLKKGLLRTNRHGVYFLSRLRSMEALIKPTNGGDGFSGRELKQG